MTDFLDGVMVRSDKMPRLLIPFSGGTVLLDMTQAFIFDSLTGCAPHFRHRSKTRKDRRFVADAGVLLRYVHAASAHWRIDISTILKLI